MFNFLVLYLSKWAFSPFQFVARRTIRISEIRIDMFVFTFTRSKKGARQAIVLEGCLTNGLTRATSTQRVRAFQ